METQENQTAAVEEQSQILNQEEIEKTLNDEPIEEEVVLPSDTADFSMPSKFEGKSAEEIARAYVELEKFKASKQEEGGDPVSTTPEPTADTDVQQYVNKVVKGEELTEEDYTTLQEKHNLSKEQIDEQIEFIKYKQEKYVDTLLEEVGGRSAFKEAVGWAQEALSEDEIKEFNAAMEEAPPKVQKVLARNLINQYKQAGNTPTTQDVLHTNNAPQPKSKGYQSQHELMQDMSDPRYGNDRSYTKMVEKKMSMTDDSKWD
jgi:hypothetical protein